jgi:hypothetical protein
MRQPVEALGPEASVVVEPTRGLLHGLRTQPADDSAPALPPRDQPRAGKHVEVLDHRRQRDRERLGEFAYRRAFLLAEPRQQRPPRRIGERREGAIERA